jgi:hypothetical protein
MVRTYKRKTTRGTLQDILERASDEAISQKRHLRSVADACGIGKTTLYRFCKKKRKWYLMGIMGYRLDRKWSMNMLGQGNFSDSEENEFVTYLLDASKMFLSCRQKRQIGWLMN